MSKEFASTAIRLNAVDLLQGAADPTAGAGLAAPVGSLYLRSGTANAYLKTAAPDTGWTKLGGDRQGFLYIATGAEGDDFFVNLPAARASSNYGVTPSCQGVTRI